MLNQHIKRKVYIDMDGVIADFFKALENKYNVKHWQELDIDKTINKFYNSKEIIRDFLKPTADAGLGYVLFPPP